ncbi:MAG: methyltransferase [bacterium]|nr:methyltransferase [bacterium]
MAHRAPDRLPVDIGATSLTGIRPGCQVRLKELLGFTGEGPAVGDPPRVTGRVDERILRWAGTDFRAVGAIANLPSVHERRLSPTSGVNCWGIRYGVVGGEGQITGNPLRGATVEDLRAFAWPEARVDERLLERWEADAKALRREGRYVVVAEHPVLGVLELGCWMCGYDDFLLRLAMDQDFVREFFDRVLAIQLAVIEQYYGVLGPYIDLTTSGDDFGTQAAPFMSPEMFESLIVPYFAPRIRRTKELGRCYYWHHSCGSIRPLIDPLIAIGVDILNPVQTSAAGMDPAGLKAAFGDRLVFWGVMAPAHEIQDDIPAENIVAWVEALNRANAIWP